MFSVLVIEFVPTQVLPIHHSWSAWNFPGHSHSALRALTTLPSLFSHTGNLFSDISLIFHFSKLWHFIIWMAINFFQVAPSHSGHVKFLTYTNVMAVPSVMLACVVTNRTWIHRNVFPKTSRTEEFLYKIEFGKSVLTNYQVTFAIFSSYEFSCNPWWN